jgi:hypothetical protein
VRQHRRVLAAPVGLGRTQERAGRLDDSLPVRLRVPAGGAVDVPEQIVLLQEGEEINDPAQALVGRQVLIRDGRVGPGVVVVVVAVDREANLLKVVLASDTRCRGADLSDGRQH